MNTSTFSRSIGFAALILLLLAIALTLLGQYTDLDLILADSHFDPVTRTFPWDHHWFARDFMHGTVKNVLVWFGFLIIGMALADFLFNPFSLGKATRAKLYVVALSSVLEPLVIRSLKSISNLHCPWGIDRYGGSHPFLRLLDAIPEGWQAGHCFPAGHASTAMWLSALAVIYLPHAPRRAIAVFFCGLAGGMTLGWTQQMRGQHFLSHTLWTAWFSTTLILVLLLLFRRQLCFSRPWGNSSGRMQQDIKLIDGIKAALRSI